MDLNDRFLELTLSETIEKCVLLGSHNHAWKLKTDFKVSDKQFWWLKIAGLTQARAWDELERFANSKKSPIGYEPFVEMCLKVQAPDEAARYVSRCQPEQRPLVLIRLGFVFWRIPPF